MKNVLKVLSVLSLVTLVLTGCGKKDSNEKKVFNHYQTSECKTLDSNEATDAVSGNILYNATERLVRINADGELLPGVAKDWKVSDDGLKLTFNLRDDSMWVDNEGKEVRAVTADDFVSTIDFMKKTDENGEYSAQNAAYVTKYLQVEKATAVDDTTLEITLAKAEDYSISIFSHYAFGPRPAEFVEELGGDDKYGLDEKSILYNGPFYISEYDASTNIKLSRNETYWDNKNVDLDEVNVRVFVSPDPNTLVAEYEEGNLDTVGLTGETVTKYAEEDDVVLFEEMAIFNFVLNLDPARDSDMKYFAQNVEGRKALAQAYDANYITKQILKAGIASPYWVPQGLDVSEETEKDFRTDTGKKDGYLQYDVEAAKKSWEEFKKKTGKDTFTLEILNYDSESSRSIAEYVQQELQKNLEGLTVNIKPVAFQDKLELGKTGQFDINFYGWSPDYPNAKGMLTNFETTSPYNEIKFTNAEYDELLVKGDRDSLIRAEEILMGEQVAMAPGYQRQRVVRVNPDFENYKLLPFGGDYDYSAITIK
ncbi:MAG: peptide ABC transporter substrate-binding protein [Bacilli bacterium]